MINIKFIDEWSNNYDKNATQRDVLLHKKIDNKLSELFPNSEIRYITEDILYDIVDWKAPRVKKKIKDNNNEFAMEVTKYCFSSCNEQFKIEVLRILKGVSYRVASSILYFCFPKEYIVMDYRAWWTLQQKNELPRKYIIKDDFEHWKKYLLVCKQISLKCGCSLRKLDKALWQYSKVNQKRKNLT